MKRYLLYPNPTRDVGLKTTIEAAKVLASLGVEVFIHKDAASCPERPDWLPVLDPAPDYGGIDLVAALGGDGTILRAAGFCARPGIPILGINTGRLGFLAELETCELHLLNGIVSGRYDMDLRVMLDVEVHRGGKAVLSKTALNDAVICRNASNIITLDLALEAHETLMIKGDGVIVATPTGSTAYSMSAGGPIAEPCADNIIITPICPHGLYYRSITLRGDRTVSISPVNAEGASLSVDGLDEMILTPSDRVSVSKSRYITRLLRIKRRSFFDIISKKLSS